MWRASERPVGRTNGTLSGDTDRQLNAAQQLDDHRGCRLYPPNQRAPPVTVASRRFASELQDTIISSSRLSPSCTEPTSPDHRTRELLSLAGDLNAASTRARTDHDVDLVQAVQRRSTITTSPSQP